MARLPPRRKIVTGGHGYHLTTMTDAQEARYPVGTVTPALGDIQAVTVT